MHGSVTTINTLRIRCSTELTGPSRGWLSDSSLDLLSMVNHSRNAIDATQTMQPAQTGLVAVLGSQTAPIISAYP